MNDTWSHERVQLEDGTVISEGGPVLSRHYAIGKPNQICLDGKFYIPVKEEIADGVRTVIVKPE